MYQERYKDLNVQKLRYVHDPESNLVQIEAYGEKLDGTTTWVLLHVAPNADIDHVRLEE